MAEEQCAKCSGLKSENDAWREMYVSQEWERRKADLAYRAVRDAACELMRACYGIADHARRDEDDGVVVIQSAPVGPTDGCYEVKMADIRRLAAALDNCEDIAG